MRIDIQSNKYANNYSKLLFIDGIEIKAKMFIKLVYKAKKLQKHL